MNAASLRASIAGTLVTRQDAGYEQVRGEMLWNRLVPERHPEIIVSVRSEADVVEAVRFARAERLEIAVRGRGHSWCGSPLRSGTVLIDLSGLEAMQIDAAAHTAIVEPGVTGRVLSRALGEHGLAFPVGHCAAVPMSGYLLSGGLGWNVGNWGPASASLRGVDLVLADGTRVTANETSHPDLFWAARGAGSCFVAIATRFHLQLHRLPSAIHTSRYVYPLDWAGDVAGWASTLAPALPSCVELTMFLFAPPGSNQHVGILTAAAFADSAAEATRALQPLAESPFVDRCIDVVENRPTPFDALLDNVDTMFPGRHRYLADSFWVSASAGEVLALIRDRTTGIPSARSGLLCMLSGLPALPDMAFSLHNRTLITCYAIWDDPRDDAINQAWYRGTVEQLERHSTGHYIGECDLGANAARAERSFSPAAWTRLRELRRRYDPNALFGTAYLPAG